MLSTSLQPDRSTTPAEEDDQGEILAVLPTDEAPGSREKVAVMAARAKRRLPLFHVLDNRTEDWEKIKEFAASRNTNCKSVLEALRRRFQNMH